MTTQRWSGYDTASTVLTTELNDLADGGNVISAELDNSTNLNVFADIELGFSSASAAKDADAHVKIYVLRSIDGSTYPKGDASNDPADSNQVYTALFSTGTATEQQNIEGVVLPPGKFKLLVMNEWGLQFNQSNTLVVRRYNLSAS